MQFATFDLHLLFELLLLNYVIAAFFKFDFCRILSHFFGFGGATIFRLSTLSRWCKGSVKIFHRKAEIGRIARIPAHLLQSPLLTVRSIEILLSFLFLASMVMMLLFSISTFKQHILNIINIFFHILLQFFFVSLVYVKNSFFFLLIVNAKHHVPHHP